MSPVTLSAQDLALAASLIVVDVAISIGFGLRLHRPLLVASVRMVVQLLLVGLVLRVVFRSESAVLTLAIVVLMMGAAAREVAVRPKQRLRGWGNYRISAAVVAVSSLATVLLALMTAIRPDPWHDPRYAIPLMGIVLGSVLNSASIALDAFLGDVVASRNKIEGRLALGASLRKVLAPSMRDAVRRD
jgi:putative ABC transport system permease protein